MTTIYFADGSYFKEFPDEQRLPLVDGRYTFVMDIGGQCVWVNHDCSRDNVYADMYGLLVNVNLKTLMRMNGYGTFKETHHILEGLFINGILNGFVTQRLSDSILDTECTYIDGKIVGREKIYSVICNYFVECCEIENIGKYMSTNNEGNDDIFILENKTTKSSFDKQKTDNYHYEQVNCYKTRLMNITYLQNNTHILERLQILVRKIYENGDVLTLGEKYSLNGDKIPQS